MSIRLIPLSLITLFALGHPFAPLASAQTRTAAVQLAKSSVTKAPATAPTLQLRVPSAEAQLIMIRSSLLALSQANLTNNYTVLNALGSPGFQSANPPSRLSQTFAPFRINQIDLAPLGLVQPRDTAKPVIENGRLRLVGLFPTAPMQVNYDLTFEPIGGQWRLFGLAVNLSTEAEKRR